MALYPFQQVIYVLSGHNNYSHAGTAKHENGEWRNGLHRKTKHTQYSALPHTALICYHAASQNSHSAGTQPIRESHGSDVRQPSSSDFACWIGADNVRVAPKASDAAEHTKQKCSRPRPSLSKRFRRLMVGPVCSCLNPVIWFSWVSCKCTECFYTKKERTSWRSFAELTWRPLLCLHILCVQVVFIIKHSVYLLLQFPPIADLKLWT